ncbi:peptidoglycan-binding protein [Haloechinothrix sp. YIM 98757]|uniref:Peptidoglycan-binding protein n=1 Tax=Haloechinothrix aidingensis TaxID=2752311 RepID=A0A838AAL3_9PSEU|nr:peptidoglycan-binding domain-containing protein [Haloechinothrix aidingensis]MBA0126274.1 peptidoglycan-binding protein [Haloechinothrix aidingensis]
MALLCSYQGASSCTSGPTSGARALMAWFLGAYSDGVNTGIYNCRTVAGSSTTSLHGEGRAADLGVRPHGAQWGTTLADALRRNSRDLGVQCIIWNRRIWSGSYCQDGWRTYNGSHPHHDHLHVELTWDAANSLTADQIEAVLGGSSGGSGGARPYEDYQQARPGSRVLYGGRDKYSTWSRGSDVEYLQRWLDITDDGYFGPQTHDRVRWYQDMRGIAVDGEVGPQTWGEMGIG